MAGGVAIATTCIWLALTNPYLEFEFRIAGSRVSMFWELIYWARMYIDPKKSKNMLLLAIHSNTISSKVDTQCTLAI